MKPKRIQLRRSRGWRMPPNTVKVDRSTPWGNPFITGKHGTREEVTEMHRRLVSEGLICITHGPAVEVQDKHRWFVKENIHKLKGKNLACWCPLDKPCHTDTLLSIANKNYIHDNPQPKPKSP